VRDISRNEEVSRDVSHRKRVRRTADRGDEGNHQEAVGREEASGRDDH